MALQSAELGITVNLTTLDVTEFYDALNNRAFDMALVNIAPTVDPDLYDFWSQEAVIRGQNYGGWNSRHASEAMEQARQLSSYREERQPLYNSFLGAYANELPALTIYQHVTTYGAGGTGVPAGTGWMLSGGYWGVTSASRPLPDAGPLVCGVYGSGMQSAVNSNS